MSPEQLALLEQGYQQQQSTRQASTPAPKKKRNFWVDQISTATGTIGGIAGGILGAAGGAGIGAVPGAAIGGAAGGGIGEAIENLIDPQGGNWGNVAKEAAVSGLFAGGPLNLGKAGLRVGAKVLGREAAEAGAKAATRTVAERTSQSLLGKAWGIRTGAKAGAEELTPQAASKLQSFVLKEVGVPKTASADVVAERLVNFKDLAGKNIDDIIKVSDRAITPQEAAKLSQGFTTKISKIAGLDPTNPTTQTLLNQAGEAKTLGDLIGFRRNLDEAINFSRKSATPDPVTERVARAIRGEIDATTSKLIPGLKNANTQYSRAAQALDFVLPAAKSPQGIKLPGFLGSVGGEAAQSGRAAAGRIAGAVPTLGKTAGKVAQSGFTAKNALGVGVRQAGRQLFNGQAPEEQMTPEQSLEEALMAQGDVAAPQDQPPEIYPLENLRADIQRDPKNAQEYLKYYASLQEVFGPVEQKPMGAEAQKRALTSQSGLRSIQTLEDTLARDPGAFQRQALPNPLGITGRLTGTTDVRAATDNVVDVLGRLRSGAAITDAEAKRFARLLPQPGDNPQSAARKIANVRAELESFMTPVSTGGLEDMLMQYQGGAY